MGFFVEFEKTEPDPEPEEIKKILVLILVPSYQLQVQKPHCDGMGLYQSALAKIIHHDVKAALLQKSTLMLWSNIIYLQVYIFSQDNHAFFKKMQNHILHKSPIHA